MEINYVSAHAGTSLISYPHSPFVLHLYVAAQMRDLPDCRVKEQSMQKCKDGTFHRKTVVLKYG